jgi:tetratricopeptide (TPR) repeat protein
MWTQAEQRALKYLAQGEYEKAIEAYKEILKEGEDPDIYNALGDIYLRINKFDEAVKNYEKALELYRREGFTENAIAVAKKLQRHRERNDLLLTLAELYAQLERNDEAIEYLSRYLEKDIEQDDLPLLSDIFRKIGESISKDSEILPRFERLFLKLQELIEKFGEKSLEAWGEYPPLYEEEGPELPEDLLGELMQYEESISLTEEEHELTERGVEVEGDEEEKIEEIEKEEIEPKLEELELQIEEELPKEEMEISEEELIEEEKEISIEEEKKEEVKPSTEFLEIVEILKKIRSSLLKGEKGELEPLSTGKDLYEMELFEYAIPYFQEAMRNPSTRLEAYEYLARTFMMKGEIEYALKVLKRGLEEGGYPEHSYRGLFYTLGRVYEKIGNREEAIRAYEETYLIDADYEDVSMRLNNLKEKGGIS